ncbi:2-keto-4-pentenoate hydratase [Pandoraea pulmonicola]|nr:2-keto-4-pentenoate hydratase [Pandoraea pulmonicola]
MMKESNVVLAAQALREARKAGRTIPRISETFNVRGLDDAYAVAELNAGLARAQGRTVSGKKVGLTSRAVQQQLGVDEPDFGVLYGDMEFLTGEEVPVSRLVQPKAEGEIAFVIGRDLTYEHITWGRFLASLEYALPAIEFVDSVIADWDITLEDTVADNASCGLYALGDTPKRISELDFSDCPMRLESVDGKSSEGNGAACMGNPLYAAWWLARTLSLRGQPLKAGEVVLSGALGPMIPVSPGEQLRLRIGGLGQILCRTV